MSLRRAFLVLGVVLGLIGAMTGLTLIALTSVLHRTASGIETSIESVSVAEELEFELITYRESGEPIARLSAEERLRNWMTESRRHVGDRKEAEIVTAIESGLDAYIAAVRREDASGASLAEVEEATRKEFDSVFRAARRLVDVNVEQARAQKDAAAEWDRIANVIGLSVIGVVMVTLPALAYWLRSAAFRPALELASVIERYARGDRAARSTERGAAEFKAIAHRFNDMASTIERQRTAQLAFLAGVAHDLRNPLSALKLASEVIAPDRPLPPEDRLRQSYARVQRQIDRLERMVFDFLDAAVIEAGKLDLQMEESDIRDVALATADLFEPTAPAHRLIVSAPEEPVQAVCDPARMAQVLNNLVSNAIKYSPRGGEVHVVVEGREDFVTLSVQDEGVGIAPEDIEHLFEPFQRTGSSSETIPGVGLGLFVARRIVEAHGGRISVESVLGEGSTFRVHLPVRPHAQTRIAGTPLAETSAPSPE